MEEYTFNYGNLVSSIGYGTFNIPNEDESIDIINGGN